MDKATLDSIGNEFLLRENDVIFLLKKAYKKVYLPNSSNVEILAFDFERKKVHYAKSGVLYSRFVGSFQKTKKGREVVAEFVKLLKHAKRENLKKSFIKKKYIVSNVFNGNEVIRVFLDRYDENFCYFYAKHEGKRLQNFRFKARISHMFDADKIVKNYNFLVRIIDIKVDSSGYDITCTRKNNRVLSKEFDDIFAFFLEELNKILPQYEVDLFLKSFKIVGVKSDKGVINIRCLESRFGKILNKLRNLFAKRLPHIKLNIFWKEQK